MCAGGCEVFFKNVLYVFNIDVLNLSRFDFFRESAVGPVLVSDAGGTGFPLGVGRVGGFVVAREGDCVVSSVCCVFPPLTTQPVSHPTLHRPFSLLTRPFHHQKRAAVR